MNAQLLPVTTLMTISLLMLSSTLSLAQTQERKQIPGTKFIMAAPAGFTAARNFIGFQDVETNSSIMLMTISGPYDQVSSGLTDENLLKQGVIVSGRENLTFNNRKAILLKGTQKAYGMTFLKKILVFGNDKRTVIINGAFPEERKQLDSAVMVSMLSVQYDEKLEDGTNNQVMVIDTRGTTYILSGTENKMLTFKQPEDQSKDAPILIASPSIVKALISDQKAFAVNRLKQLPGHANAVIKETNPIEINGLKGFEVIAENKGASGKTGITYQVMLFTDNDSYYVIVGIAYKDIETNLVTFKKLARTVKRI
jgi:hypothetical protein